MTEIDKSLHAELIKINDGKNIVDFIFNYCESQSDRKKLLEYINNKENITAYQKTIWRKNCTLLFSNQGGRNSTIGYKGTAVEAVTIDYLAKQMDNVTYIKMDVEGAEKQALCGGVKTILEKKPKLNIAAYHTFEDLFDLALMVYSINPEYKLYLRHHPYIPLWDTNLYCV